MRIVVSNTGPLLHLMEAGNLELVKLAGEVHIPGAVAVELAGYSLWHVPNWVSIDELDELHETDAAMWQQAGVIDMGEAATIALARQLQADWLLTDDAAARFLAQTLGFEVHGSVGVIVGAAADGYLNRIEAEAALNSLERSSLWLSPRVLAQARDALNQIYSE
jgi:predicted nucleic acid-binding protein